MSSSDRLYPLPRPEDDPRFKLGLMLDVAAVLEKHGYPKITSGFDLLELQQALFGFIYAERETFHVETGAADAG